MRYSKLAAAARPTLLLILSISAVVAAAHLLPPEQYQLHLIAEVNGEDRYCRMASVGSASYLTCDRTEPDSWTSMTVRRPAASGDWWDSTVTGMLTNLFFRPSSMPLAKVNSYSGVVMISPTARFDPFIKMPATGRPPTMFVPLLEVKFFVNAGVPDQSIEWGYGGSTSLLMRTAETLFYDANGQQHEKTAYCTVRDLSPEHTEVVEGLRQLVVCDPELSADEAVRFRLLPYGIGMATSLVLMSHKAGSLCGYHKNEMTCSGQSQYNICCVGSSTTYTGGRASLVPWWSYRYKRGFLPPLTQATEFSIEAWDANTKSPLRYISIDMETGKLIAVTANSGEPATGMAYFRFEVVTPGQVPVSTDVIPSSANVFLYSVDLEKYCVPSGPDGAIVCDTDTIADEMVAHYTFTIGRYDCPRAEYLCMVSE